MRRTVWGYEIFERRERRIEGQELVIILNAIDKSFYDSGTMSGVMGEQEMDVLRNVEEEDVLIKILMCEHSISKLYDDTIFGKTQILRGHHGSIFVSQYTMKNLQGKKFILSVIRKSMMTSYFIALSA
jgi:hypothetical protein